MKQRRIRRSKDRRSRRTLRPDKKFIKQLEANPLRSVDVKWTFKERRCLQHLVLNQLPYAGYRLRKDNLWLTRVILLYDHYWTLFESLRNLRNLQQAYWNASLVRSYCRLIREGGEGIIGTLSLLI